MTQIELENFEELLRYKHGVEKEQLLNQREELINKRAYFESEASKIDARYNGVKKCIIAAGIVTLLVMGTKYILKKAEKAEENKSDEQRKLEEELEIAKLKEKIRLHSR